MSRVARKVSFECAAEDGQEGVQGLGFCAEAG